MSLTSKELKKKTLIKKTLNEMNQQIQKLEKQKTGYLNAAKEAKTRGLTAQYNLAMNALKMTMAQQKRVYEMKLNFEVTSQMKDMAEMTADFLKGMSVLSKDMAGLTKVKDFRKVGNEFMDAMVNAEASAEMLEEMMGENEAAFEAITPGDAESSAELEKLVDNDLTVSAAGGDIGKEIDEEMKKLEAKLG